MAAEFETGGGAANGLNWFVTGHRLHENGWRSDVVQLFGKFAETTGDGNVCAGSLVQPL